MTKIILQIKYNSKNISQALHYIRKNRIYKKVKYKQK